MILPQSLRQTVTRLRRGVASPMSGTLAYTILCMVTLAFAVCLDKMPMVVIERVSSLRGYF